MVCCILILQVPQRQRVSTPSRKLHHVAMKHEAKVSEMGCSLALHGQCVRNLYAFHTILKATGLFRRNFYEILVSFTSEIEAVSCDEALLDVSNLVSEGRFAFTLLFVCFLHIAPNQILG